MIFLISGFCCQNHIFQPSGRIWSFTQDPVLLPSRILWGGYDSPRNHGSKLLLGVLVHANTLSPPPQFWERHSISPAIVIYHYIIVSSVPFFVEDVPILLPNPKKNLPKSKRSRWSPPWNWHGFSINAWRVIHLPNWDSLFSEVVLVLEYHMAVLFLLFTWANDKSTGVGVGWDAKKTADWLMSLEICCWKAVDAWTFIPRSNVLRCDGYIYDTSSVAKVWWLECQPSGYIYR